jgi:hypothetical protein
MLGAIGGMHVRQIWAGREVTGSPQRHRSEPLSLGRAPSLAEFRYDRSIEADRQGYPQGAVHGASPSTACPAPNEPVVPDVADLSENFADLS